MTKTYDLKNLGLSAGNYNIAVKSTALGHTTSVISNSINYEVVSYSISATCTNVTASASNPTSIVQGGTAVLTFTADGTNYKVPTNMPTITGATGSYTRTSDTECSITLSNPTGNISFTVVGEAQQSYPVKGQLITMTLGNATPAAGTQDQYRVLSINGSIAEVVAMYDVSITCSYSTSGSNTYSGEELDTMLNTTFYSSLSSTAKAAIVDKTITSYEYSYNDDVYNATTHASYADYSTKTTHESIGSRHVYALDVEDIETYFNGTFSTANIWTLFWNTTAAPSTVTQPWLRSADADDSYGAWYVTGSYGRVSTRNVSIRRAARPALTIDLSKISWS